jgi:hypothetical protein
MDASAKYYSVPLILSFLYDLWVLKLSNSFAWHCPTASVLLPFFQAYISKNAADAHLDVGVGTGFYPARALASNTNTPGSIALLDLNPDTLHSATKAIQTRGYRGQVTKHVHNAFVPVPPELQAKFASVSLFYLFHCLPGAFPDKATRVAAALAPALTPGDQSVFYGATVLGKGAFAFIYFIIIDTTDVGSARIHRCSPQLVWRSAHKFLHETWHFRKRE